MYIVPHFRYGLLMYKKRPGETAKDESLREQLETEYRKTFKI